jgi:hypothetical protein
MMSICPGCGLQFESNDRSLNERFNVSNAYCQLYGQLSVFTLSLRDKDFIHQLIVDTYAAQHSGPKVKPIDTAFALIGIYLTFEKDYTGKQVQRTHMFLGKKRTAWPRFNLPQNKSTLTVLDVLQSQESQYEAMIRKWGKSVWKMWQPEHENVREFVEQLINSGTSR